MKSNLPEIWNQETHFRVGALANANVGVYGIHCQDRVGGPTRRTAVPATLDGRAEAPPSSPSPSAQAPPAKGQQSQHTMQRNFDWRCSGHISAVGEDVETQSKAIPTHPVKATNPKTRTISSRAITNHNIIMIPVVDTTTAHSGLSQVNTQSSSWTKRNGKNT
jgi:hypothetical protein